MDEPEFSPSATPSDAELGELGDNGLAVRRRTHVLVDIRDSTVGADIEGPPRRKWLIGVNHAVGGRNVSRWIAQERVVHAERLRERLVRLGSIDADREVSDVEVPNLIPTLTE
jgi:hypothetical protein